MTDTARKTLYVDMDNVLVDFPEAVTRLAPDILEEYEGRLDEVPGIFGTMKPIAGAIDAYTRLAERFDTYILSTAPWRNPSAWTDKLLWVHTHLPDVAYKRLILSHHKHLLRGHFLVDDRTRNGADCFEGTHIHFGTADFPDWPSVEAYLAARV